MEIIKTLKNNDQIIRLPDDLVIQFSGNRKVLGSSRLNGGYREDLQRVFNHCDKDLVSGKCMMQADTYREHLTLAAKKAGLIVGKSSGLSTAVEMKDAIIQSSRWRELEVTAIVTGGILTNGRRVADKATMWEEDEKFHLIENERINSEYHSGTINILLHLTGNLSQNAMVTAVMIATEAKVAAIQEINLHSCYSDGLATGSGTDGVIIVCDKESNRRLTQVGTDTKCGECMGEVVKQAVKQALINDIGMKENERRRKI